MVRSRMTHCGGRCGPAVPLDLAVNHASRDAVRPGGCRELRAFGKTRAQGMPGVCRTHSLACKWRKHASKSPQVRRNSPVSLRDGLAAWPRLCAATPKAEMQELAENGGLGPKATWEWKGRQLRQPYLSRVSSASRIAFERVSTWALLARRK